MSSAAAEENRQQPQEGDEEEELLVGVIEGFYGRPWTPSQRVDLLEVLSSHSVVATAAADDSSKTKATNPSWCYVYAPKDDSKHRAEWRSLYNRDETKSLSRLITECTSRGVRFLYALSPGLDLSYSSSADLDAIKAKFSQLASLGCRDFAIFFDDIDPSLPRDQLARGQAHVSNELLRWLLQLDVESADGVKTLTTKKLLFCPTEYCEMMTKPSLEESVYVNTLANELDPRIVVMWTGDDIIARTITEHHVRRVSAAFKRKPFIWDNFYANDYDLRRIYTGPFDGREQALVKKRLISGIVLNPNREHPANYVPTITLKAWSDISIEYDPRKASVDAAKLWLPRFESIEAGVTDDTSSSDPSSNSNVITLKDVRLLIDLWYHPHRHGDAAVEFIKLFGEILRITTSTNDDEEYGRKRKMFHEQADSIVTLFRKLTCIKDRDLLYTFYAFAWEAKEEVLLLKDFVDHLDSHRGHSRNVPPCFSEFHKAGTFRGGFVADLQRLYRFDTLTGAVSMRSSKRSMNFSTTGWRIVPFSIEHLEGVYRVCLETSASGEDGTHLYPGYPHVVGQRYVGPYVTLQPDLAFVLIDPEGNVCGYVLGALDTKSFYKRVETEWYPKMRELYVTPPLLQQRDGWSNAESIIDEFHNPRFFYPEALSLAFRSHLHIDLIKKAQGFGLGSAMLQRLLDALIEKGSKGVFLEMSSVNERAKKFYHKFGFVELCHVNDDCEMVSSDHPTPHTLILGKTL